MQLQELNHWWAEKKVREEFIPQTRRDMFYEIDKNLKRRQIQVIAGLRRVGKSTILFQLIDSLISRKVDPLCIVYCSFDEPELQERRIEDILKDYSRITNINYKKSKIYLFLDEAQKAKNWVASVKLIYDNMKNIKIIISGSASMNILSEAKKNLAGRIVYFDLKPLSFNEFLHLKGINIEKNSVLLHEETLKREFEKFIQRPFPELVNEKDPVFIKNYIRNSVIEPVILKDIPKEFEDVDIILLEKLVNIFFANPGQYLMIDELAKEFRRAKKTLYNALFYLEFSFLIRSVLNFRPSIRAASRKLSRIYPYHPCLTLPFNVTEDRYAEIMVLFELDTKYYWREREKEIDFLKNYTPFEVKFKDIIDKNDTKWVEYFVKKYGRKLGIKKAYIITKDIEKKSKKIHFLPLWKFCFRKNIFIFSESKAF